VLLAIYKDSDADVAPCGGITTRPPSPRIFARKFQVTSPIQLLSHFVFRPVRDSGLLPHTRFMRLMTVASVLCIRWQPIAAVFGFRDTECHGSPYFPPNAQLYDEALLSLTISILPVALLRFKRTALIPRDSSIANVQLLPTVADLAP